jgi:hypothetical protein
MKIPPFMGHELRDLPVTQASHELYKGSVAAAAQGTYLRNFNRHTYLTAYIRVRKTSGCNVCLWKALSYLHGALCFCVG